MFPTADFLLYCLVSFATPGPNTLMALEQGRRKGFRRGIWLNLGMLCGLSAVMLLCLAFSKVLYDALPLFQPLMRLVGAAYMLYQAWKCLNRKDTEGRDPGKGYFLTGLLMQFINPKVILLGISIISNYLLPHFASPPALAAMALSLAFQAFAYGLVWLACGAALSRFLSRHQRPANAVMALLLVYCAWKILH